MTSPNPPTLSFACVYPNEVPVSFMNSWTNFLMFDIANWGVLGNEHGLISVRYGTDGLVAARNNVVEQFLRTNNEWLIWVDADMGFAPTAVYSLLAVAQPKTRPVVGGLCFASREVATDGMNGYRTKPTPTIFQPATVDGVETVLAGNMYPVNSLVRCAATGSAFVLVHRSVFEAIGSGWYNRMPKPDGTFYGEDVSFCLRVTEAGLPIHVYTGAKTSHFKPRWVSEVDYWEAIVAPPAVELVDVLVPVLNRPQNAAPFMASLRASTGLATAYAICDASDLESINAWKAAGAVVITWDGAEPGSFAQKVNLGFRESSAPWVFLVGDDVRFRAGWLDHAQHIAHTFDGKVIGTNDLGNPRVTAGDHATHVLIERSYVDTVGASWDRPGVVAHEGYRHWFVDDEIVTVARQRGVWQMALGSYVEHLHPAWGKAETDAVYELGESYAEQDRKVYESRCSKFL